jgi:hypothetical protein
MEKLFYFWEITFEEFFILKQKESMNVKSDFRYVNNLEYKSNYTEAMNPKTGRIGKYLVTLPTAVIVDSILYVHAGILPNFAKFGIEKLNQDVRKMLLGEIIPECQISKHGKDCPTGSNGPLWTRYFTTNWNRDTICETLSETLEILKVKRMVIGHTPRHHIDFSCKFKLVMIDVGLDATDFPSSLKAVDGTLSVVRMEQDGSTYEDALTGHDEL